MSGSVIQSIEAEAMAIVEEAKKRAQKIVEEAKAKAREILEDKSYLKELEEYRRSIESKLMDEVDRMLREARVEAEVVRRSGFKKAEAVAKRIASIVAGVEL